MVLHQNIITAYIGTRTNSTSKGIYRLDFNKSYKDVDNLNLAYEVEDPAYLAIDTERHIIYSTCKMDNKAGVISFKYWREQNKLNLINYNVPEQKQPCHISICQNNQLLISSNCYENEILVYNTLEGIILNYPNIGYSEELNLSADLKDNTNFYFSVFTYDKKYIISTHLGLDKLEVYELNNNSLIKKPELDFAFPLGTGPKNIVYFNSEFIYILSKLTSEIFTFKYNPLSNCIFENIQTINSLPPEYTGNKSGAAIRIHPNKKYLYTSDAENNSISIFLINSLDGTLELLNIIDCHGDSPNDFQIDPSGNYLFVANEKSNNISIFSIIQSTGNLIFLNSYDIPSPTCIEFI
ncbi:MAG: lactonase family protein [Clostridium sp.]